MNSRPQYHHYIPRFILRRWAVEATSQSVQLPHGRSRRIGDKPNGLNVYDVSEDELSFGKEIVDRMFGSVDMYKDTDTVHTQDAYHIEKALSRLEDAASKVIAKLEEERSSGMVCLYRSEVNTLRRFLFIMSFRIGRQYDNWTNGMLEPRTMEAVRQFAVERGVKTTRDAFLLTLGSLLDSEHWEVENNPDIFQTIREDYVFNRDSFRLVFYEAPNGVEFTLSDTFTMWQGYKGPSYNAFLDSMHIPHSQVNFHINSWLFPLTPKLAVMLRNSFDGGIYGILGKPYFADLPSEPAECVYDPPPLSPDPGTKEEWIKSLGGCLESRLKDRFTFRVFNLSTSHARMITSLLLENSQKHVVFLNIIPLYKSILAYERDKELEHKADHSKLKKHLIQAHRASQLTFFGELTVGPTGTGGGQSLAASEIGSTEKKKSRQKHRKKRHARQIVEQPV